MSVRYWCLILLFRSYVSSDFISFWGGSVKSPIIIVNFFMFTFSFASFCLCILRLCSLGHKANLVLSYLPGGLILLSLHNASLLFLVMFFFKKFNLSNINITHSCYFWLMFEWYGFSHCFIVNLCHWMWSIFYKQI